jgi:hypothetical protein
VTWRIAHSLDVLLAQFNQACPTRSKLSDGGIGNAAHVAEGWTNSDHNPWYPLPNGGVVTARDYTHDPAHGMDINVITDQLAAMRDPRIKYIIANRFILDSRPNENPWRWMAYHGVDPHINHLHLSVMDNPSCDDMRAWNLPMFGKNPLPVPGNGAGLPTLMQGQHSAGVVSLQKFLNAFNWVPALPLLLIDGDYGPKTVNVVAAAQRQMMVQGGDGTVIGPQTKNALWARGWRG